MRPQSYGLLLVSLGCLFGFQLIVFGTALTPPDVQVAGDYNEYILSWSPIADATDYGILYNSQAFSHPNDGIVWQIVQNTSVTLSNQAFSFSEIYLEVYALKTVAAADAWLTIPNGTTTYYFQNSAPTYNIHISFTAPGKAERIYHEKITTPESPPPTSSPDYLPIIVSIGAIAGIGGGLYLFTKSRHQLPSKKNKTPLSQVKKAVGHAGNPKHHRRHPR